MRVRVIKAEHLEAAAARLASRLDVRLRFDEEPVGIVGRVSRPNGLGDRRAAAEQEPAALGRLRLARMPDDVIERGKGDPNRYNASTATAIPIPPPMQSDATP